MEKNKETEVTKRVCNLVFVDESGSMSCIEREACAGINETIATCQKMQTAHPEMEQLITLVTFNSSKFKVHLDDAPADKAHKMSAWDYNPCAATPLYDAIGKSIARLNAQTEADTKVLVTIITDGEENCSEEYDLKMVKNLIEKLKKQGWTFTLIGTDDLDVEGMACGMGIDNHLEFAEDEVSTKAMFMRERKARERFSACILADRGMTEGSYFDD